MAQEIENGRSLPPKAKKVATLLGVLLILGYLFLLLNPPTSGGWQAFGLAFFITLFLMPVIFIISALFVLSLFQIRPAKNFFLILIIILAVDTYFLISSGQPPANYDYSSEFPLIFVFLILPALIIAGIKIFSLIKREN